MRWADHVAWMGDKNIQNISWETWRVEITCMIQT